MKGPKMNIETKLEFDKIKEIWKNLAVTEDAKAQIDKAGIILKETELQKALKDTTDARDMIEKCGAPPLESLENVEEIMVQSQLGKPLAAPQLERISVALAAVYRLQAYLARGKSFENSLGFYDVNLDPLNEVREEILQKIRGGEVDSHASSNLLRIRSDIMSAEEKMKQKVDAVMRSNKDILADSFSTYRNGRLCVPVKREWRYKLTGSVIDKSASGNTVFIEPSVAAKCYEEIQALKFDEENEVYQILFALTSLVAENAETMNANIEMIRKLDYIFSKGKLSLDLRASRPEINPEGRLSLKNARHPLMDRVSAIPLSIEMNEERKGIIITGPNTGGKTVAIKTVALNCLMAQCGLHITCEEADVPMRSSYLCDIGDGQNIHENLSTFSAHIKSVLEIIAEVSRDSLVIMDELGSGTDPTEGMGIAISILEELRKSECLFLVTTHYPEVKEYAKKAEKTVNARMEFDKNTLSPTYHMVIGEAGESCAFYIAERLGMPERMLRVARCAAYGATADNEADSASANLDRAMSEAAKAASESFANGHHGPRIQKRKVSSKKDFSGEYTIGDSVFILPEKKIGIVCEPVNEKGVLRVQLPNKKIWINHKRVKLNVKAEELYPEDYDLSIVFDSVETRKYHHEVARKYTDKELHYEE